jgi:hypothetical protein
MQPGSPACLAGLVFRRRGLKQFRLLGDTQWQLR